MAISPFILLFLSALLAVSPQSSAFGEKATPIPYFVSVKGGRVTIRAEKAELAKILNELSRQADFQLYIYEPLEKKVSITIENAPIEEALRKLVPNYGFLFRKTRGEAARIKSVAVLESESPNSRGYRQQSVARLPYGSGPGQLGLLDLPEMERQGPQSFAVDPAGNIYICDTVNRRVSIFNPEGTLKRTLTGVGLPSDIAVNSRGDIYILDEEGGGIITFLAEGEKAAEIPLPPSLRRRLQNLDRGEDGEVVLMTRDQRRYELTPPDQDSSSQFQIKGSLPGAIISSRRSCRVQKISSDLGEVILFGPGEEVLDRIPVPVDRLASIALLGRDRKNNLYLQIEQLLPSGEGVDLKVIKMNPGGIILDKIENIPTGYASWTARLLQVNRRGEIYQMLPGAAAVELNRWIREANGGDSSSRTPPVGKAESSPPSPPPTSPGS